MKLIDFIRLIRKHLVLLVLAPMLLAALVIIMTLHPNFKYASETTLYTGIASGNGVEMNKSFNYFTTNTAFDNLINIVKSRKTQQEVAIRLLSLHLMLDKPDPKYVSAKSYDKLKQITPSYIYSYVVKDVNKEDSIPVNGTGPEKEETLSQSHYFSIKADVEPVEIPYYLNRAAYEQTVENLTKLMESSDTNFVYDLLNYPNPHYSYKELSEIKVQRIANSDLVQIRYETDDPGICQQTLLILTNVCIRNYRDIKENRSNAVVKYFEQQLQQASVELREAENKLLQFNKDNKIINYYEQSKAVAIVKEDLDVDYNKQRMKLAGIQAAIQRLEEKMGIQEQIQMKSSEIMELKSRLSEVDYKIARSDVLGTTDQEQENTDQLKKEEEMLKTRIKEAVSELYSYGNTMEGVPLKVILNDWIENVIEAENVKAGLDVLKERIREFEQQYSIYAPAGANIKRIEREISVSEQEFLEILHGLNLAKLKMQDNELSSNIKVVDKPFFPISPIPTKRKILVLLAAILGFVFVLSLIIVTEYFDQSLRNLTHATKVLKLNALGLVPKILMKVPGIPLSSITTRLTEIIIQHIELEFRVNGKSKPVKTILFFSTHPFEGKTVIAGNLALQLKNRGKNVLFLNYADKSVSKDFKEGANASVFSGGNSAVSRNKSSVISRLLGYPDNRIDFANAFLKDPEEYLEKNEYIKYPFDQKLPDLDSLLNYARSVSGNELPEYVLIEIPAILNHPYAAGLISGIDLSVLICRANRVWTEADQSALDSLLKLKENSCSYILNGVELQVVESVLGELPRKRSWLRRAVKRLVLFQFLSKNHL